MKKIFKRKKAEMTSAMVILGFFLFLAKMAFWAVVFIMLFLIFWAIMKAIFSKAAKGLPKKWEKGLIKYFK